MNIGIIGLGLVGRAIAQRLLRAGHDVRGFDRSIVAAESSAELGVQVCEDAATAVQAEMIVLALMDSDDRRELLWGDTNLIAELKDGITVIDVSTSRPEDIVEDAAKLNERNVRLIDASIVGSSASVEEGRAIALVGATDGAGEVGSILRTFTRQQFYFGEAGRGNRMKLVVNLVLGLNRLALAEGLSLARKDGLDLDLVLNVLREGDAYSKVMNTKGPKMIEGEYDPPAARLSQHAKDVELILERAAEIGADVPLSKVHAVIINRLVDDGHGGLDNAAIFKAYD